jgi:DNA repair protein RecN (Recombination protein N)
LIKALNRIDDFQDLAATVAAVPAHLNEIEHKLVELLSQEDSETSLENLYSRKADLQGLIRKHGVSLNELIAKMESERVLVQAGESPSDEIARLVKKLEELEKRIAHIAGQLSNARKELASKLDKLVTAELAGLKMSGSVFRTEISSVKNGISEISGMKLDRSGADSISFGMAHGASGSVRPIAKAASGGELSRIMLALQVVLPSHNPDLTYVFDEVDAGIGGETAIEVGRRLAQLAKSNQVIVVTHLPQVAAFADVHFSVSGDVGAGIKTSDVSALTIIEREVEIARMLGGMRDSKAAITHAKELLELKR